MATQLRKTVHHGNEGDSATLSSLRPPSIDGAVKEADSAMKRIAAEARRQQAEERERMKREKRRCCGCGC